MKVIVRSLTHVWNNRNRASILLNVPCEATPFNGYATTRVEVIVVTGQTARGIIARAEAEGFSSYAPTNSNSIVLTPRTRIGWEE